MAPVVCNYARNIGAGIRSARCRRETRTNRALGGEEQRGIMERGRGVENTKVVLTGPRDAPSASAFLSNRIGFTAVA